jgi:hypothetical protein
MASARRGLRQCRRIDVMNRKVIIISVVGLSLLMLGTEKTLNYVLGGVLGLVVNGVLSGTPGETINKRPNGHLPDNKIDGNREISTDLWRTLAIPSLGPETGEES